MNASNLICESRLPNRGLFSLSTFFSIKLSAEPHKITLRSLSFQSLSIYFCKTDKRASSFSAQYGSSWLHERIFWIAAVFYRLYAVFYAILTNMCTRFNKKERLENTCFGCGERSWKTTIWWKIWWPAAAIILFPEPRWFLIV